MTSPEIPFSGAPPCEAFTRGNSANCTCRPEVPSIGEAGDFFGGDDPISILRDYCSSMVTIPMSYHNKNEMGYTKEVFLVVGHIGFDREVSCFLL